MEQFKQIANFYGLYEVSDKGNVRGVDRKVSYTTSTQGTVTKTLKGKLLRQVSDKQGYKRVILSKNNYKQPSAVHRLVAEQFIPNPDNKPCVNHKNGIKYDNAVENLEWVTYSENSIHSFANKLQIPVSGEEHINAKLSNADVINIRSEYTKLAKQLAKQFGVSKDTIHRIVRYNKRVSK